MTAIQSAGFLGISESPNVGCLFLGFVLIVENPGPTILGCQFGSRRLGRFDTRGHKSKSLAKVPSNKKLCFEHPYSGFSPNMLCSGVRLPGIQGYGFPPVYDSGGQAFRACMDDCPSAFRHGRFLYPWVSDVIAIVAAGGATPGLNCMRCA